MSKKILIFCNYAVVAILMVLAGLFFYNNKNIIKYVDDKFKRDGFKIEEIHISDLQNIDIETIIDSLDFNYGDSVFLLNLDRNRRDLESNFWIKSARLKIIFPNIIDIQIEEKKPKFVWFQSGVYYLINDKGEILKKINDQDLASYSNYITLLGDDANYFVPNLLEFIEYDDDIYNYIATIELVNKRRWNIKFINDMVVQLPYGDPVYGWHKFVKLNTRLNIINNRIKNIDLRVKDKVFIELDMNRPKNEKILKKIG